MSGGSFNYLFLKRGADLMAAVEDIRAMRDTLVGMDPRRGLPEAIRGLDELLRLTGVDSPANAIADRLEGVMRAVEWWQSSDMSEDDVTAALRGNERPAQTLPRGGFRIPTPAELLPKPVDYTARIADAVARVVDQLRETQGKGAQFVAELPVLNRAHNALTAAGWSCRIDPARDGLTGTLYVSAPCPIDPRLFR